MDKKSQIIRIAVIVVAIVAVALLAFFQVMKSGREGIEVDATPAVEDAIQQKTAVPIEESTPVPVSQNTASQKGSSIVDIMTGGQVTARPALTPSPTPTKAPTAEPTATPTPKISDSEEMESDSSSILNMMADALTASDPGGYLSSSDLESGGTGAAPTVTSSIYDEDGNYRHYVRIGGQDAEVHQTPNSGAAVFGTAKANQSYPVLHVLSSGWYEIMLDSGVMGYISSSSGTLVK